MYTTISEDCEAKQILQLIKEANPKDNIVIIEMSEIKAITTSCAKLIFGYLFSELGETLYNTHIDISSATRAVNVVIRWGISESLIDKSSESIG